MSSKRTPFSNDHELVKVQRATKRQLDILRIMKERDETLFWTKGGGWWIDLEQTSGATAMTLIRFMCIKEESTNRDDVKHWEITSTGLKTLETGYFYTHPEILKRFRK